MNTNLTVKLENVTPELAKNYLRFNLKNRKPSPNHIDFLSNEMKKELFLENGESIIFDKYGNLKDGQHRLLAIIKSSKSYNIPIVRGVEPDVMATYDTGKNRSAADVLSLNGYKSCNNISSLIKAFDKYNNRKSSSFTFLFLNSSALDHQAWNASFVIETRNHNILDLIINATKGGRQLFSFSLVLPE
jgi:hypothetical protein